jgi:aerobic carbon-monoxide dehydrogenase medium subunit
MALYMEINDGTCVEARIAVGACGPIPVLVPKAAAVLVGSDLSEAALAEAAHEIAAAVNPIDDVRGRREHRLHVLPALLRANVARIREKYAGTYRSI